MQKKKKHLKSFETKYQIKKISESFGTEGIHKIDYLYLLSTIRERSLIPTFSLLLTAFVYTINVSTQN